MGKLQHAHLASQSAGDGAVLATGQQPHGKKNLCCVRAHGRRQQPVRVSDVLHGRVSVGSIVERPCMYQLPQFITYAPRSGQPSAMVSPHINAYFYQFNAQDADVLDE